MNQYFFMGGCPLTPYLIDDDKDDLIEVNDDDDLVEVNDDELVEVNDDDLVEDVDSFCLGERLPFFTC